VGELVKK